MIDTRSNAIEMSTATEKATSRYMKYPLKDALDLTQECEQS